MQAKLTGPALSRRSGFSPGGALLQVMANCNISCAAKSCNAGS
jgi:hypothetical protein